MISGAGVTAAGAAEPETGAAAATGAAAVLVAYLLDHSSIQLYPIYDYWHTSPNFFMMRVGLLLMIAFLVYAWCQWGLATRGAGLWSFSPLIQLGQASLLVYWVHIEFVYGRFSLFPKRSVGIATASRGLLEICLFMLILAPIAAMLIQLAVSRSREYEADATGAHITGNPYALASALEKLDAYSKRLPLQASASTAHLFIVAPLISSGGIASLFATHPPIKDRIARLIGRPGMSGPVQ